MNKTSIAACLFLSMVVVGCAGDSDGPEQETPADTPTIVEVFACSDNCPGPEEQYIKRVYDGVTDAQECRRLGGRIIDIVGWGTRRLCEVQ